MSGRRVLLIGLDGAAPGFIRHWAERGALPFLAGALADGASGVLSSTVPPYTPTAWTSIVTGVNPGRHGVFGLTRLSGDGGESLVDSGVCRTKTVWDLLTEQGRPSVVISVPMTYPPRPLHGVLVSGMGTPPGAGRVAVPDEVGREIQEEVPGYVPDVPVGGEARRSARSARAAIDEIERVQDQRLRVAELLLQRHEWEFGMVVFESPDRLQHLFWKAISPEAPPSPERDRLLAVYGRLDAGLARLAAKASAAGPLTIVIVSDHGFQDLRWLLAVNNHLADRGFLALRRRPTLSGLARGLPPPVRRAGARIVGRARATRGQTRSSQAIDWARTVAFCGGVFEQAVHVCREDHDRVGEVEAALLDLPPPSGDGPALAGVFRREEIYRGPCVAEAPDLFPQFGVPGVMMVPRVASPAVWEGVREPHGTHHPDGLLLAVGPGVARAGGLLARTEDVAATVLALLGGPLPMEMEGRPIHQIAPEAVPFADVPLDRRSAAGGTGYTPEQEGEIIERLRGLGYFE